MTLTGESNFIVTGSAWADFNYDGYSDIVVTNIQNNGLYQNRGTQHSWIIIDLIGTSSNTSAIGTKVKIKAIIDGNYVWQIREINGQNGSSLNARFGLGDAAIVEEMIVYWPSGHNDTLEQISTNTFYSFTEGGILSTLQGDEVTSTTFFLGPNYPNPFNPTTSISYSLPEQSAVKMTVFDIRGREVLTLLNEDISPGNYEVQWCGMDQAGNPVSTGVYFCRLEAGTFSHTIKMVYLR